MGLDDIAVTKGIFKRFAREFEKYMEVDVAIAGAGPAGLTAARFLAEAGKKVVIFERKLSPGGGMWGGGMTFPVIIVTGESKKILEEIEVDLTDEGEGYYSADSVESVSKACASAIDAGAKLFNAITVEDVLIRNQEINGFVLNWSAVESAGLHVDPLSIRAQYCIDATGHDTEVCEVVQKKVGELNTPSGKIENEKSMCAEIGEKTVVENTKEVYPGLFVSGMAANAVYGAPRMGPIFGGMIRSGRKVAEEIINKL